ncbi:uncharacterized protein LOC122072793 [Macadamia integrifolia]|uniref:uncharacterized protein LOC122072793 n=1 Tax=Macadamia integrifolia TaxID=60698 RepID=UPI001C4E3EA8|nr:uncharacterized protein LOC122072793 [Macadamia integrifolia]
MTTSIKEVAKEVLGLTKGGRHIPRKTWWWNNEVQAAIKIKKDCFKTWQRTKEPDDRARYHIARNDARKIVGKARAQKYDDLYENLNTKEGEKEIYRIAKIRERMIRDLDHVRYIKSEDGRVLVRNKDIMRRWGDYFCNLLNEHTMTNRVNPDVEGSNHEANTPDGHLLQVAKIEVKEAMRRMNIGRTMGPDENSIEV